jgi:phosphohistidine phosphatase SixA
MAAEQIPGPTVVHLLLVRHAHRERDGGELAPLTPGGRWQAENAARWLEVCFRPEAVLCSRSRHAHEHAEITTGLFAARVPVVAVTALTPHTAEEEFSLAGMRREAGQSLDWTRLRSVVCIGHEPRLNQLARRITGEPLDTLQFGEVLCVEGDSWEALELGRGRITVRNQPASLPIDDTQLLPKIQSKMQTSALLAGFTSAAFGVVLAESDYWTSWAASVNSPAGSSGWRAAIVIIGLTCLALSTLLFVISIYMYDRLAMPQRYWETLDEEPRLRQNWWRSFRQDRVRFSLVYAYMIWVWRYVFSVAVGMAMLGFLALVAYRGVWLLTLLFTLASVAVIVYYRLFRPELGVD